jgi:hypothetical protein
MVDGNIMVTQHAIGRHHMAPNRKPKKEEEGFALFITALS